MTIYTISFFPRHTGLNLLEHERLIKSYGKWLDTIGKENDLYTWSIGKYNLSPAYYSQNEFNWPAEVGVNIYDEETALAFKLKFGL